MSTKSQMGLQQLFATYEPPIRTTFDRIVTSLNNDLNSMLPVKLELTETDKKSLFVSIPSRRLVRVEWRGIASLWAISQAAGHLCLQMHNARRNGVGQLDIQKDSVEELGLYFIDFSKQLCVPQTWRWNSYFPLPDRHPDSEHAQYGELFFDRSLEWILHHEVAHIVLGHDDFPMTQDLSRAQEKEADFKASQTLKSELARDATRAAGARPSAQEIKLEQSALAAGVGLIWVALFEDAGSGPSNMHPAIAERLHGCLEQYSLAKDSGAAEILSDLIKAWIGPESDWPTESNEEATAQAALDVAATRLDEFMRARPGS